MILYVYFVLHSFNMCRNRKITNNDKCHADRSKEGDKNKKLSPQISYAMLATIQKCVIVDTSTIGCFIIPMEIIILKCP